MARKIHSKAFLEWLERFGLIPENTRRVVIEASVDSAVMIYAELFGTSPMVEVDPPPELRGARVVVNGGNEVGEGEAGDGGE